MVFEIERRQGLSYEEFAATYLYPLKPVIVTDAIRDWRALARWSPEFFKAEFGGMQLKISAGEKGQKGYEGQTAINCTMADFIDRVLCSTEENPAPYLRNQILYELFPSLRQDIQPLPNYFMPNWLPDRFLVKQVAETLNRGAAIELYIGGKGGTFPVLHYDGAATHAFLMQVYGRKQFMLFSPDQASFLYPSPEKENLSLVNVEKPDLDRFPLFAKAVKQTFVLEPGELAFIPSRWWHTTKMLTPSISISANVVNQSNWRALVDFVAMRRRNSLVSMVSRIYLTGAGAWRSWRDRDWKKRMQNSVM
jgi:histone arginine demethylase JMJD6